MNTHILLLTIILTSFTSYAMEEAEQLQKKDPWHNPKVILLNPPINLADTYKQALTARCALMQAQDEKPLSIYNSATGNYMHELDTQCTKSTTVLPLTDDTVALGSSRSFIEIWDLYNNKRLASLENNTPTGNTPYSFSEEELLVASQITINMWNLKSKERTRHFSYENTFHFNDPAIQNIIPLDSTHFVTTVFNGGLNIAMQLVQEEEPSYVIPAAESILSGYSPSNIQTDPAKQYLMFEALNKIHIHDFASGKELRTIENEKPLTFQVIKALSGTTLAALSDSSKTPTNPLRLYDIATGQCTQTFEPITITVDLDWTGAFPYMHVLDEHTLMTVADYQTLQTWDTRTGKCTTSHASKQPITRVVKLDHNHIIGQSYGGLDNRFVIWNTESGEIVSETNNSVNPFYQWQDGSHSPDGKTILYLTPYPDQNTQLLRANPDSH